MNILELLDSSMSKCLYCDEHLLLEEIDAHYADKHPDEE